MDAYGVEDEGEEEEPLVEVGFPPAVADRALAAIVAPRHETRAAEARRIRTLALLARRPPH